MPQPAALVETADAAAVHEKRAKQPLTAAAAAAATTTMKVNKEFDVAKWAVSIAAAVWVAHQRSGFALVFLAGCLVNSVAAKLLKRALNQPRPATAADQGLPDPGMPSSHAHMLFFLAVYLGLLARETRQTATAHAAAAAAEEAEQQAATAAAAAAAAVWTGALLATCGGGAGAVGALSCAHRVKSGKHTAAQVLVGAATGGLGALGWAAASAGAAPRIDGGLAWLRRGGGTGGGTDGGGHPLVRLAEWPLLLGAMALGLFFLTGGGRKLSMRGGEGGTGGGGGRMKSKAV